MSIFVFIYAHIEAFIGVLIALILLVGIIFVWRMINEPASARGEGALDMDALETTLKRLIAQAQSITQNAGAPGAAAAAAGGASASMNAVVAGTDPGAVAKLQNLLSERDRALADLQTALADAKKGAQAGGGEHALALLEMQNKVRDLEARLAEYSIIEDDIADLSMYKEENVRLKRELADIRGGRVGEAAAPAPTAQETPATVTPQAAAKKPENDVLQQFQTAVSDQAVPKVDAAKALPVESDPLAGSLDTGKMLEEMEGLDASKGEDEDVLADALDTDKLMSELSSFGVPSSASAPAPAAAAGGDISANDDLFGEFKDEEKT